MKTMDNLRSVIFETIDDVRKGKLDAATAKAISELSQIVINSAKAGPCSGTGKSTLKSFSVSLKQMYLREAVSTI